MNEKIPPAMSRNFYKRYAEQLKYEYQMMGFTAGCLLLSAAICAYQGSYLATSVLLFTSAPPIFASGTVYGRYRSVIKYLKRK